MNFKINYSQRLIYFFATLAFLLVAMFSSTVLAHPLAIASYLPVKNGKIEYYRFGHGDPIVLISGYHNTISSWNRTFLEQLSKEHQVIIFNNRNVGGTTIKSANYTTEDLAQDTFELIKGLRLNKPTILGFSMGGMIAQQYAISYPDHIHYLILMNTTIAGARAVAPSSDVENTMFNPPKNGLKKDLAIMKLIAPTGSRLRTLLGLEFEKFKVCPRDKPFSPQLIKQQHQLIWIWSKNNKAAAKIAHIKVPVLILNGGSDAILPPINSEILAKTIPHAVLLRWENGGHSMMYQYPKELAYVVNEFLANNP